MQELEEEIQNPSGITTISPPPLSMTGVLVSKECGLLYEITETEGLRLVELACFEYTPSFLNVGHALSSEK